MTAAPKFTAALAALALVAAGCGSDSEDEPAAGSSGSAEKPASVTIPTIIDQTGVSAFFAERVQKGMELAVKQANEADVLKGTKIELDIEDSGSEVKQGVTLISSTVKDDPPAVLFGTQGGSALAMAPIAQRNGTPFIVSIAGTPGVVETGDHVYRATAPQSTYHVKQVEHLAREGVKKLGVIYASDSASLAELGEKTYPELAKANGMQIVSSTGVASADTELSSVVSKLQKGGPDAVIMLIIGKQNVSVAKTLRTSGYKGIIASQYGIGSEALKALGASADGILYPSDFTSQSDDPAVKEFVALYQKEMGREPDSFDANGYVAAQMLIKGLEASAGDYSAEGVQKGLTQVTSGEFTSATGTITFEERDARVEGVLLEWQDGKETVVPEQ